MVVLTQGLGPFVSRRDVCVNCNTNNTTCDIGTIYGIRVTQKSSVENCLPLKSFDFSSSLFYDFSEEKQSSLEGPPGAKALFAFSAWIQ